MGVLLLRPDELQGLVTMRDAIDAIEQGYREANDYPVINAPRRRVHSPAGVRVSNFPGGVHGLGVIGSLTRAELVQQAEGNRSYAHREHPVYVLHDSHTGHLLAILFGEIDEKTLGPTSLMALRTAATSGVPKSRPTMADPARHAAARPRGRGLRFVFARARTRARWSSARSLRSSAARSWTLSLLRLRILTAHPRGCALRAPVSRPCGRARPIAPPRSAPVHPRHLPRRRW